MNDLNGRILPDTSTANPPAYNTWKGADRDTLMNAVLMFDEANKKLNKENIALRADMAKLEAENAELRKKLMTNFERLKNVGTVNEAAEMIYDALWRHVVDIDINYITAWLESRNNT